MEISQAHTFAANLTKRHSAIMHITSIFYTPEHRRASNAIYAFFRTADDLVDEKHISLAEFRNWRQQTRLPIVEQTDPTIIAWADIRARYKIDFSYEEAILDGLELDLVCHRYKTMDELKQYCYGVGVAPALLAMSIVGFRSGVTLEQAKPYIENMGMALQLTDIIRDVGEDVKLGRIYLPESELAAFDLTFADIEARRYDERFKRLMQHFTDIARNYYVAAWPILNLFTNSFRLAGGVGLVLNRILLAEVEKGGFDVFTGIKISTQKKLWLLATKWPAIYWTKMADKYFK